MEYCLVQRNPDTFREAFKNRRQPLCETIDLLHTDLLDYLQDAEVITDIQRRAVQVRMLQQKLSSCV